jgi:hypothetical protein
VYFYDFFQSDVRKLSSKDVLENIDLALVYHPKCLDKSLQLANLWISWIITMDKLFVNKHKSNKHFDYLVLRELGL